MIWTTIDTWIVVTAALAAIACALPGSFLVLRNMSMMGDAISHAVLPGLALAYLFTGERSSIALFAGAAITGILTAVFTQWISRFGNVDRGASMGIVFTTLFALGLILIVRAADYVDLDPGCVLYGALESAPLETVSVAGLRIPQAVLTLAAICCVNALVIGLLFKEFRIAAFDPTLATTVGISSTLMHYLLMGLVAMTVVASFEAVGSIIVIALLIVPPSTAKLIARTLPTLLLTSLVLGIAASFLGHAGALALPAWFGIKGATSSGMVAVASGLIYALIAAIRAIVMQRLSTHHNVDNPTPPRQLATE